MPSIEDVEGLGHASDSSIMSGMYSYFQRILVSVFRFVLKASRQVSYQSAKGELAKRVMFIC